MNRFDSDPNSPGGSYSESGSPGNHSQSTGYDNPWGVSDCEEDDEEDNNNVPDYVPPVHLQPKQRSTRMSAVINEELQQQQNPVQQKRVHNERYSARSVFFPQMNANITVPDSDTKTNTNISSGMSDMIDQGEGYFGGKNSRSGDAMQLEDVDEFDDRTNWGHDNNRDAVHDIENDNIINRSRMNTAVTVDSDVDTEAEYSYSYSSSKHAPTSAPPPALAAAGSVAPVQWQHRDSPPRSAPMSDKAAVDTTPDEILSRRIQESSLSPRQQSIGSLNSSIHHSDNTLHVSNASNKSSLKRDQSPSPLSKSGSERKPPSLPVKPHSSSPVRRSRSSSLSPERQRETLTLSNDLDSIMGILEDDHNEEEERQANSDALGGNVGPGCSSSPSRHVDGSSHTTGGIKLKNMLKAANAMAAGGSSTNLRHSASGAEMLHSNKPSTLTKPPLILTNTNINTNAPGGHGITRSSTMPPLSTHVPTTPIVPHSAVVTSKLTSLSEFAIHTLVIMEGWMERQTNGFFGWKKVYAVLSESTRPEEVCVLHIYDKMIPTSWGNIPMHLKATIPLHSIESIETESHRFARGREFTIRKKAAHHGFGSGSAPTSGHNSRSPSPLHSPHSVTSTSPPDALGGYDSDRGSIASGGSANSRDSKHSVLSWFGKGTTGPKDLHLRCEDAETRLIWTVLLMKALELASP